MKRLIALVILAFFLLFSSNTLTACKQKPKEEPAVEEGAEKPGEAEEAEEPQAVAPAPAEEPAPAPAPAPAEEPAPAPAPTPESPEVQP